MIERLDATTVTGASGTIGGWFIAFTKDFDINLFQWAGLLLVTLPTGIWMWWKVIDKIRASERKPEPKNEISNP